MRVRVFPDIAAALAAQRALDLAAGLPRIHQEGAGEGDFSMREPGQAAARIRARGVRTEHTHGLIEHPLTDEVAMEGFADGVDLAEWLPRDPPRVGP